MTVKLCCELVACLVILCYAVWQLVAIKGSLCMSCSEYSSCLREVDFSLKCFLHLAYTIEEGF